jgi:hypothetical protein
MDGFVCVVVDLIVLGWERNCEDKRIQNVAGASIWVSTTRPTNSPQHWTNTDFIAFPSKNNRAATVVASYFVPEVATELSTGNSQQSTLNRQPFRGIIALDRLLLCILAS